MEFGPKYPGSAFIGRFYQFCEISKTNSFYKILERIISLYKEMKKVLNYISYQSFPANTANSLQTISNLKYLARNHYEVRLFFPLREKNSSDDLKILQKYYHFNENISVKGLQHPYPFGKFDYFNKLFFHLSHYLWGKSTSKIFAQEDYKDEYFFTRSDWILYFLAKKNLNIIFECHQYSKVRNFVFNKVASRKNVQIIFLNDFIKKEFSNQNLSYLILPSAVDLELFENVNSVKKEKNKITFVGNLLRFGKERNLDIVINALSSPDLKNYKLSIIGGPDTEARKIKEKLEKNGIENIKLTGRLERTEVAKELNTSSVGLLINSPDKHSKFFTSPLKYFEYLAAKLRVVAIDYPSHKILPFQENIHYFKNKSSLISAINEASKSEFQSVELVEISLDTRAKKIINLFDNF